ncbi:hypothetical protein LINPERPRIM_LOCUS28576 [Linum perenne]
MASTQLKSRARRYLSTSVSGKSI